MKNEFINIITLSGIVNNVYECNSPFVLIGLTTNKLANDKPSKVFANLKMHESLYNTYKDFFVKGNKIYVKGYINSYSDKNNKINNYISVTKVATNYQELVEGVKAPHIRNDEDGVMVWNGKRCESEKATPEEMEEMENLLREFREEDEICKEL